MTDIYVDGDACPVREEIYRVATRLRLNVLVVSNGSRPIRPPGLSNVSMVLVDDTALPDAAAQSGLHRGDAGKAPRGARRAAEGARYCGQGKPGEEAVVETAGVGHRR